MSFELNSSEQKLIDAAQTSTTPQNQNHNKENEHTSTNIVQTTHSRECDKISRTLDKEIITCICDMENTLKKTQNKCDDTKRKYDMEHQETTHLMEKVEGAKKKNTALLESIGQLSSQRESLSSDNTRLQEIVSVTDLLEEKIEGSEKSSIDMKFRLQHLKGERLDDLDEKELWELDSELEKAQMKLDLHRNTKVNVYTRRRLVGPKFKPVMEYIIEVTGDNSRIAYEKQYKDFLVLQKQIQGSTEIPREILENIPKLPGETLLKQQNQRIISQRMSAIEAFMTHITASHELADCSFVTEFLAESKQMKTHSTNENGSALGKRQKPNYPPKPPSSPRVSVDSTKQITSSPKVDVSRRESEHFSLREKRNKKQLDINAKFRTFPGRSGTETEFSELDFFGGRQRADATLRSPVSTSKTIGDLPADITSPIHRTYPRRMPGPHQMSKLKRAITMPLRNNENEADNELNEYVNSQDDLDESSHSSSLALTTSPSSDNSSSPKISSPPYLSSPSDGGTGFHFRSLSDTDLIKSPSLFVPVKSKLIQRLEEEKRNDSSYIHIPENIGQEYKLYGVRPQIRVVGRRQKKFIAYCLEISITSNARQHANPENDGGSETIDTVTKEYNDYLVLEKRLRMRYKRTTESLPKLPNTILKVQHNPKVVLSRVAAIREFISMIFNSPELSSTPEVRRFFIDPALCRGQPLTSPKILAKMQSKHTKRRKEPDPVDHNSDWLLISKKGSPVKKSSQSKEEENDEEQHHNKEEKEQRVSGSDSNGNVNDSVVPSINEDREERVFSSPSTQGRSPIFNTLEHSERQFLQTLDDLDPKKAATNNSQSISATNNSSTTLFRRMKNVLSPNIRKRKRVSKRSFSSGDLSTSEFETIAPPPIHEEQIIVPERIGESKILTDDYFVDIHQAIPARYKWDKFTLLYSLDDGVSFQTFFRKTHDRGSTIIVLKTSQGDILGGFASQSWKASRSYYGSGETFVFAFQPEFKIYRWSEMNSYFMLSLNDDSSFLAFGGGDNHAIRVDSTFEHGTTGYCQTFDSPPLLGEGKREFNIVNFEVWGFTFDFN